MDQASFAVRTMTRRLKTRAALKLVAFIATTLVTFLLTIGTAQASHFRYGAITWTVPDPVGAPRTVQFTVVSAWRAAFVDGTSLDFGDGNVNPLTTGATIGSGTDSLGNAYTVTQYQVAHTYAAVGTFTAFFTNCCRIAGLQNGAGGNFTVQTIVSLVAGNTAGPISAAPAIIQLQAGNTRTYSFPMFDADGDPVTCRFATAAESGLPAGQTVPAVPVGGAQPVLTNGVNVCTLTWNLTLAVAGQQYVLHNVYESTHGGVVSASAIDLIVEIVAPPPPQCAGSGVFAATVGQVFTHTTTATWTTAGAIAASTVNAPAGSTLLPAVGGASPLTTTFTWTPAAADGSTSRIVIVNYTTTGVPANLLGSCFMTITVGACPVCAGGTPICNPQTHTCRACVAADCTGNTPICSATAPTSGQCIACNGDNGTGTTATCTTAANPYCSTTGACGKCATDTNCTTGPPTHSGLFCNVGTGTCNNTCTTDAQCGAGNWCNNVTTGGTCQPKVTNGNPVPGGVCIAGVATRACVAGVCDADNNCAFLNGDGPCNAGNGSVVCRSGACDTDLLCGLRNTFGPCNSSGPGSQCRSQVCDPDMKCGYANGDGPCTGANQGTVCRSLVCATSGPNANTCEQCNTDANCSGGTPACSTTTNKCVPCTASNSTLCTGLTPICNASNACAPCNGDNGSGTTLACPTAGNPFCVQGGVNGGSCGRCLVNGDCRSGTHTGSICNTATGGCGNTCFVDADCAGTEWCGAGTCTPKTPNGQPLPGIAPINGTCTANNGARVCLSAVCSVDNKCGYVNGDGPCTGGTGGTVCRSQVCATSGPNNGKCEQCVDDSKCSGASPACNLTTNGCVQCTATNKAACTVNAPVCNTTTSTCGPCNGDNGDMTATLACGTAAAPFCKLSGTGQGQCGKCMTNTDCVGHPLGPICEPVSGACGKSCMLDADCTTATQWCNAPQGGSGSCVPKLPNGDTLPTSPTTVSMCSTAVGTRVCLSGACDTRDNKCGFANGDGPCNGNAAVCRSGACDSRDMNCGYANGDGPCAQQGQCRSNKCDTMRMVCVGCTMDSECMMTEFCDKTAGACKPRLPNGGGCTANDQCQSGVCDPDGKCGLPDGKPCTGPTECRTDKCTAGTCGGSSADGGVPGVDGGLPPLQDDGSVAGGGWGCALGNAANSNGLAAVFGLAIAAGALARRRRR